MRPGAEHVASYLSNEPTWYFDSELIRFKFFKKLELMIDFAGLSLQWKILALWDNGHVSSQLLSWIFLKALNQTVNALSSDVL